MDILFVCLGNICRSPAAEGVARSLRTTYAQLAQVDSAGTGNWHAGNAPDPRMCQVAAEQGCPIEDLRARQVVAEDFHKFDHIVAMDRQNLAELRKLKTKAGGTAQLQLLREACAAPPAEVPDPYYGGLEDFQLSFRLIREGVESLLQQLTHQQNSEKAH